MKSCTYCGEPATDRDHLVSCASQGIRSYSFGKIVPACRQCNGTLGAVPLQDISSRAGYLLQRYSRLRKKLHMQRINHLRRVAFAVLVVKPTPILYTLAAAQRRAQWWQAYHQPAPPAGSVSSH